MEQTSFSEDNKALATTGVPENMVPLAAQHELPQIQSVESMTPMQFGLPQPAMVEAPVTYSTEEVPYNYQHQQHQPMGG